MRLTHPLQISVPKRLAALFASNEETSEQASNAPTSVEQAFPPASRFLRRFAPGTGPRLISLFRPPTRLSRAPVSAACCLGQARGFPRRL